MSEGKLVTGPELIKSLEKAFADQRTARLAIAYWGTGAAERIGIRKGDDVKVICNLSHGGTNPKEIARLRKLGVEVRQHPKLHAKIGIVGGLTCVGSSNMSANGLGGEGNEVSGWEEANVVYSGDPMNVKVRFDALWESAQIILNKDIKGAQATWDENRKNRSRLNLSQRKGSLLDAIMDESAALDDARVFIALAFEATEDEQAQLEKVEEELIAEFGEGFDSYIGWEELPSDAYLVTFEVGLETGQITYTDLWRRPTDIADVVRENGSHQVVKRINDILGLKLSKKDAKGLIPALKLYWDEHKHAGVAKHPTISEFRSFMAEVRK